MHFTDNMTTRSSVSVLMALLKSTDWKSVLEICTLTGQKRYFHRFQLTNLPSVHVDVTKKIL